MVRKFELFDCHHLMGEPTWDYNNPKLSLSDRFSRAAQWTSQQCGRLSSVTPHSGVKKRDPSAPAPEPALGKTIMPPLAREYDE
jgi:hypothetical protein